MTEDVTPTPGSRRPPGPRGSRQMPDTPAGGTPSARRRQRPRVPVPLRALAAVTAALLLVDAYVHFHDAGFYESVTTGTLSQATLFRVQAAVAVVVAIALLIRPGPAVWAIAVVVAGSAAVAVLLYTNVDVGRLGPLPDMYEPTWALPGKRASAVAESAATVLSLAGLALSLFLRPRAGGGVFSSRMKSSRTGRSAEQP
jgi:hypothetical protein